MLIGAIVGGEGGNVSPFRTGSGHTLLLPGRGVICHGKAILAVTVHGREKV
jgi:hypothetical protein